MINGSILNCWSVSAPQQLVFHFSEQKSFFFNHLSAHSCRDDEFLWGGQVENKRNYGVDKNLLKVNLMDDITMKRQERSLFLGIGGGLGGRNAESSSNYV